MYNFRKKFYYTLFNYINEMDMDIINKVISHDIESLSNKNCSSGLNMIDDVTLTYMVNTSQYEKYLKKNNVDFDSVFKRDIRFYRKRIILLTKDLFKDQFDNKNQSVLSGAFNMYMRACISYLKFLDQSETIQKCYVCQSTTTTNNNNNSQNESIKNQKCVCKNKNENDIFELHKANELCFKPKEVKKITLDNYVIRQNVKKNEPIVYPKQFTFNPRDPQFKRKGLKPKVQSEPQEEQQSINTIKEKNETLYSKNNIPAIQTRENRDKIINENEYTENIEKNNKVKNNKKNKNNKKVSFNITNYIDNI